MTVRKIGLVSMVAAAAVALVLITSAPAADPKPGAMPAKEVTLTGKVIDLHCYMTGQYPSADRAKCTSDCIRAGVPCGLETPTGVVILGQGMTGVTKSVLPLAFQQVEAKGKLFEKGGVKYLDVISIKQAGGMAEEEEEE